MTESAMLIEAGPQKSTKVYKTEEIDGIFQCWFFCPGCKNSHAFTMPRWSWNGSLEAPSFQPSLMCNRGMESQCHCIVTDGFINYCADSWHSLRGTTVPMPDWEGW